MVSRWRPLVAVVVGAAALSASACTASEPAADGPTDSPTEATEASEVSGVPEVTGPIGTATTIEPAIAELRVEVVATHPHDPEASTQGLEVVGDLLLESTGLYGRSSIRLVEPETGGTIARSDLSAEFFGEGATVVGDEVWQLTWLEETVVVHRLEDLAEVRRLSYRGQGWGLCHDRAEGRDRLIMSDGSATLTFRDVETFEITGSVTVTEDDRPVDKLNELECVDGVVWANLYQTTRLVAVDPDTGRVVARTDMADLVPPGFDGDDTNVANGIAFDPETGRFWLSGKRWPVIYEVELLPGG